jgi:hypothetical protein
MTRAARRGAAAQAQTIFNHQSMCAPGVKNICRETHLDGDGVVALPAAAFGSGGDIGLDAAETPVCRPGCGRAACVTPRSLE